MYVKATHFGTYGSCSFILTSHQNLMRTLLSSDVTAALLDNLTGIYTIYIYIL